MTGGLDRGWGEIWSWKGLRFGGGVCTLDPSRPEEKGQERPFCLIKKILNKKEKRKNKKKTLRKRTNKTGWRD